MEIDWRQPDCGLPSPVTAVITADANSHADARGGVVAGRISVCRVAAIGRCNDTPGKAHCETYR